MHLFDANNRKKPSTARSLREKLDVIKSPAQETNGVKKQSQAGDFMQNLISHTNI